MTEVPLREHLEQRLEAVERLIGARLDAMDRAIELSASTLNERLHASNGRVEQMREQAAHFAQKIEVVEVARRIGQLEQDRSQGEGREVGKQPLTSLWLIVVASIISAVVSYFTGKVTP